MKCSNPKCNKSVHSNDISKKGYHYCSTACYMAHEIGGDDRLDVSVFKSGVVDRMDMYAEPDDAQGDMIDVVSTRYRNCNKQVGQANLIFDENGIARISRLFYSDVAVLCRFSMGTTKIVEKRRGRPMIDSIETQTNYYRVKQAKERSAEQELQRRLAKEREVVESQAASVLAAINKAKSVQAPKEPVIKPVETNKVTLNNLTNAIDNVVSSGSDKSTEKQHLKDLITFTTFKELRYILRWHHVPNAYKYVSKASAIDYILDHDLDVKKPLEDYKLNKSITKRSKKG